MSIFRADKKFERFEDVTPALLKKEKVKLLLCDLDNTLRLHSEKEPADELQDWVEDCRKADNREDNQNNRNDVRLTAFVLKCTIHAGLNQDVQIKHDVLHVVSS